MGANTSRNGTISVPSPSPPSTQLLPEAAPPPVLRLGEGEVVLDTFFARRADVEGDLDALWRFLAEGEGERREGDRDGEAREPPPPRLLRVRGDMVTVGAATWRKIVWLCRRPSRINVFLLF